MVLEWAPPPESLTRTEELVTAATKSGWPDESIAMMRATCLTIAVSPCAAVLLPTFLWNSCETSHGQKISLCGNSRPRPGARLPAVSLLVVLDTVCGGKGSLLGSRVRPMAMKPKGGGHLWVLQLRRFRESIDEK